MPRIALTPTAAKTAPRLPPSRPIAVGVVLVVALLLAGAWVTARSYVDLHRMVANELQLRDLGGRLLYLREQLGASARLAAETADPQWSARYRRVRPQFDAALRELVAAAPHAAVSASPTWADSAALAATEDRAFAALDRGQRDRAVALLADTDYLQRQQRYVDGLDAMGRAVLAEAQARLAMQRYRVLAVALLGLTLLAALAAAWAWISGLVQQYVSAIHAAESALAQTNRNLENRVRERTAELSTLNQHLRDEMERRSRIELELRQAQKLEAIGRLAAGVAHEINTPVQFVSDSCHFLRDGVSDTLAALQEQRRALDALADGQRSVDEVRGTLQQSWRAHDIDRLAEQLPQAGTMALEGLDRIAHIVRSMKEFSHPGSARTQIDLNRTIQNTLTIARNAYRYVADVHTDLGELPPLSCYPGALNQALLNLIVNAAQAIGEAVAGSDRRGRIDIRTRREGDTVVIEIQDDGIGINDDVREHIFEPFFTTKPIGQGSGQGLAITRAVIVDQHRGRISVHAGAGAGSVFVLRLPLVDADAEQPAIA
jgi:signal transduction histidine kinase